MWKQTIPDWLKKLSTEKQSHAKVGKKKKIQSFQDFFSSHYTSFNSFSLK